MERMPTAMERVESPHVEPVNRELVRLVHDSSTSTSRLAAALSRNRDLRDLILRKANAPANALPGRISDLTTAVGLLGFNVLKSIVGSAVVAGAFRRAAHSLIAYEEFWKHSCATALIARRLAERTTSVRPVDAFVAGLLHDVGFLLLQQYVADSADPALLRKASSRRSRLEEIAGFSHAQAGAWLAELWGLGPDIVEAIREHQTPERASVHPPLAASVHVAEGLSARLELGAFQGEEPGTLSTAALALLGYAGGDLQESELAPVLEELLVHLDEAPSFEDLIHALRQKLIQALGNLPEQEKLVFTLQYYEQLSPRDIAVLMGLDEDSVRERQHRAVAILMEALQEFAG